MSEERDDATRTTVRGDASTPAAPDQARLATGAILAGRYRIVGLLGRGGMGEVYRADDLKLDQPVALKFLPRSVAHDPIRLSRLHDEVRFARQVTHPNVCRVHDIVEADGLHFISMEYVEGEDLVSLLRRIGRLPYAKAEEIARQICAGLSAAHERQILHRDLKPANVMLDERGHVRLTDFGLAMVAGEERAGEVAGTPAYMAPEQAAGRGVTVRSEIYSLGLVLYELFTGRRAFSTPEELKLRQRGEAPPRPGEIAPDLNPRVDELLLQCLEHAPDKRPASALAVSASLHGGDQLAAVLAAGETPAPHLVAAATPEAALGPNATLAALIFVIVAGLALLFLGPHLILFDQVPLDKPPAVLRERAVGLLEELGHPARPRSEAHGLRYVRDAVDYVTRQVPAAARPAALEGARPATVVFWYRAGPRPLEPLNPQGQVIPGDPPLTDPGAVELTLDTEGRLVSLTALPPAALSADEPDPEPIWNALFEAAGLDRERFTSDEPRFAPPVFAARRAVWEGRVAAPDPQPVSVRAGAAAGRAVSFAVLGPWNRGAGPQRSRSGLDRVRRALAPLKFFVLVIALYFAWRNLSRGRWDRDGSYRLAGYVFAIRVAAWILSVPRAASLARSWELLGFGFGLALFDATLLCTLYVAVEPSVRRHAPRSLVSWRRLLSGRFQDPLVGRDVLLGAVLALLVALALAVTRVAVGWLGGAPSPPMLVNLDFLAGPGRAVVAVLVAQTDAVFIGVGYLVLLLLLRSAFRHQWLARAAFLAVWAPGMALAIGAGGPADALALLAAGIATLIALDRFGLLVVVVATFFLALRPPFTTELASWRGQTSLFGGIAVVALVLWSGYTSLAGRSLFQGRLAD